ncbi:MFS transporter [Nocardia jiangsuensis]|uniref:MFS transporter n=1 Tax=Nocardia jiangsuensis TaxID=1691563 RepID=A0ABV8DPN9_9NOCA
MTTAPATPATRAVVLVFAIAAGSSAGCLYYLQPLLHEVAADLAVSTATAALLVSAAQVGYLCGLALLVPLGDFLERRRMVPALLAASVLALVVSALTPVFPLLLVSVFATGVTASAAQVVVPWASALAEPERRGEVVGAVMSGLLLGILLSRVLAGAVAEVAGWRAVLLVAAGLQLATSIAVHRLAPAGGRAADGERYSVVLATIPTLIRRHPVLRHRMVLGFLSMACFSAVWTALAFLLSGAHGSPYHYPEIVIGLFGLAGAAGALGAPLVGKLADRGNLRAVTTGVWLTVLAGWALLAWGGQQVLVLIVALLVFDFGIQGVQLANQNAVYALDPAVRSRLTTAYMVTYFGGGVVGSVIAGFAHQAGGWLLICAFGAGTTLVGIALWTGLFARHAAAAPAPVR